MSLLWTKSTAQALPCSDRAKLRVATERRVRAGAGFTIAPAADPDYLGPAQSLRDDVFDCEFGKRLESITIWAVVQRTPAGVGIKTSEKHADSRNAEPSQVDA